MRRFDTLYYQTCHCPAGCAQRREAGTEAGLEFDLLVNGWRQVDARRWLCPNHAGLALDPPPARTNGGPTKRAEFELSRLESRLGRRLGIRAPDVWAGTPGLDPIRSALLCAFLVGQDHR